MSRISHVTLLHGDALDVLRTLPDASVDAVVTDPPYELGFIERAPQPSEQPDMKCLAATVHDGHAHRTERQDTLFTREPEQDTMTTTATTLTPVNQCAHPTDARSTLKSGMIKCTACGVIDSPATWTPASAYTDGKDQPVTEASVTYDLDEFRAAQNEEWERDEAAARPAMPARKWGDEPDPLPAVPTVLVASTDPYVNTDGDGAREYAPKPALAAAKDAFAGGWRYQFTYAAAAVPAKGEPGKRGHKPAHVLHTVALRLARDTEHEGETIRERGYAIWAREDEIAEPVVEGKWSFSSCYIGGQQNGARPYGARELRERLLRHGREVLNDPPTGAMPTHPTATYPTPASTPVPVAPIIPGSWGSLHAGDTVTGKDMRPYVVQTIERTGTWIGTGQPEVKVTLRFPDGSGEITVRKSASEPAVIAERSDTSAAAALLTAAFNITEETTVPPSTEDQFSAPAAAPASLARREPPIGRYRWYKLPHPITGDPEALWPRVSTIMKTHADTDGLTDWKIRMAMKGLAISPDLIAMVASLDVETDKGKFREAAEQASSRAESKKGANFGTAVDRFTERLDGGESITSMGVPDGLKADVEAYARTLRDHGLEVLPHYTQRTTVNVTHEYAGSWDRVVRRVSTGELFMLDLKSNKADDNTGRMSDYSWLEYISQLAAYAYGEHMCTLDFAGYEPMPEVSKTKGLILHLPSGKGRGELYGVRLESGWRNFTRSIETRRDRSEAKSSGWSWLIERKPEAVAPAPEPAPVVQVAEPVEAVDVAAGVYALVAADIAVSTTIEQLGTVARNAIEAGVWTDDLAALALGRDDQIRARTAVDQAALAALWAELTGAGRWTPEVAEHADTRAAELAGLTPA